MKYYIIFDTSNGSGIANNFSLSLVSFRFNFFYLLKRNSEHGQFFSYESTWKNVDCYECMNVSSVVNVLKHAVVCNSIYAYIQTIAHISAVFARSVSLKSRTSISMKGFILVNISLKSDRGR